VLDFLLSRAVLRGTGSIARLPHSAMITRSVGETAESSMTKPMHALLGVLGQVGRVRAFENIEDGSRAGAQYTNHLRSHKVGWTAPASALVTARRELFR
jgi:hypothetical protein